MHTHALVPHVSLCRNRQHTHASGLAALQNALARPDVVCRLHGRASVHAAGVPSLDSSGILAFMATGSSERSWKPTACSSAWMSAASCSLNLEQACTTGLSALDGPSCWQGGHAADLNITHSVRCKPSTCRAARQATPCMQVSMQVANCWQRFCLCPRGLHASRPPVHMHRSR